MQLKYQQAGWKFLLFEMEEFCAETLEKKKKEEQLNENTQLKRILR